MKAIVYWGKTSNITAKITIASIDFLKELYKPNPIQELARSKNLEEKVFVFNCSPEEINNKLSGYLLNTKLINNPGKKIIKDNFFRNNLSYASENNYPTNELFNFLEKNYSFDIKINLKIPGKSTKPKI